MAKRLPVICHVCGELQDRVYKVKNSKGKQIYICYSCAKKLRGDVNNDEK